MDKNIQENKQRTPKKKVLGRGLSALIPNIASIEKKSTDFFECDIKLIRPNPFQPRISFLKEDLEELSTSIKAQGVIQPVLVRKKENGYELIAGERRLKAAKMAGLNKVPVIVKQATEEEIIEISIVENIQRKDLNPIEESDAYYRLLTSFNLTQEQVASKVGKSRPAVANFLRLRNLPDEIKTHIKQGTLSMGHARALLGEKNIDIQMKASEIIISKSLSVRQTEELIKQLSENVEKSKAEEKKDKKIGTEEKIFLDSIAREISDRLKAGVKIKKNGQKGKIEINFYTADELARITCILKK